METSVFESKDYQRARSAYRWACAFEYFVALLVADAFLAKLLTALGMSDVPMKKILKMMYLAFDFNGQLYLSGKTSKESNFQRYYDSTSMQIKYIF